jgi:hypothetical protein
MFERIDVGMAHGFIGMFLRRFCANSSHHQQASNKQQWHPGESWDWNVAMLGHDSQVA